MFCLLRQIDRSPRRMCCAALVAAAVGGWLAAKGWTQENPSSLPAAVGPVEGLPPPGGVTIAPGTGAPVPYAGPPAIIDGPRRLPPLELEMPRGPVIGPGIGPEELAPFEDSPLGPILEGDEYYLPQKLSPYKSGFFQKLSLSAAWFGNSGDPEDLGGTEIESFLTVALPAPIKEWPLLITPGYNVVYLQGPTVTDIPPRLHFAYMDFMWLPKVYHNTTLLLSVAPSVLSDFESSGNGAFRLTGKGIVLYDWIPERLQFVAGVLYLNRDNIRLLPAGGAIWTPNDDWRFELLFPKPKFGMRVNVGPGFEDWIFATAEFGGNTWAIVRDSGLQDRVTYLDYRLLLGYERKLDGGAGYRLEAGYVFGREVTYESGIGNFDPTNTILIRGGITY